MGRMWGHGEVREGCREHSREKNDQGEWRLEGEGWRDGLEEAS